MQNITISGSNITHRIETIKRELASYKIKFKKTEENDSSSGELSKTTIDSSFNNLVNYTILTGRLAQLLEIQSGDLNATIQNQPIPEPAYTLREISKLIDGNAMVIQLDLPVPTSDYEYKATYGIPFTFPDNLLDKRVVSISHKKNFLLIEVKGE